MDFEPWQCDVFHTKHNVFFSFYTSERPKVTTKPLETQQNLAFGEKPAAGSKQLYGFIVSYFRIVAFFEKVAITWFEPLKKNLITS